MQLKIERWKIQETINKQRKENRVIPDYPSEIQLNLCIRLLVNFFFSTKVRKGSLNII